MPFKTSFRRCLLLSIVLGVAYVPATMIGDRSLPNELIAFNDTRMEMDISAAEIVATAVTLPVAIAAVVIFVGLYRFRPLARPWAVGITVASFPVMLLLGPWVDSGLASMVSNASMVFWGSVLAMMYCQPYADLFAADARET